MRTLVNKRVKQVQATGVRFVADVLYVALSDGREVTLNLKRIAWLRWLLKATPAHRSAWSIEPRGFAIYWDELDNGVELCHILGTEPIT